MGYDARIGTSIDRYKRLPLVSGKGAYILSTVVNTVQGIHRPYHVELDGEVFEGEQSLICIGNGRHYGGSFHPLPDARLDDGVRLPLRTVARPPPLPPHRDGVRRRRPRRPRDVLLRPPSRQRGAPAVDLRPEGVLLVWLLVVSGWRLVVRWLGG